ncbi:MAG TPA: hypothetical protein VF092_15035 [Longimicrobium sp.]
MSKREYIARLTADLIVRQGRYKAQIDTLAQTKRELLSQVTGSLAQARRRDPLSGGSVLSRSVGSNWTIRSNGHPLSVHVDG